MEEAARLYEAAAYDDAASCARAALRLRPGDFDALHLLGVLATERRDFDDGIDLLMQAAAIRPDVAKVHFNLGNALTGAARHAEAEQRFRRAIEIAPFWPEALNNLGNTLDRLGRLDEALPLWRRAIDCREGFTPARFNLSRALLRLGQPEAAIEALTALLRHGGTTLPAERQADIHANLGDALLQLGRYEEALAACAETRRFNPDLADWNESLLRLLRGEFALGWRLFENRFGVADHDPARPDATVPDLGSVAGKRILLVPEQGRGDMIQFARYAPLLAARGARVTLVTYRNLTSLLGTLDGVEAVIAEDDTEPEYDLVTPLMSLPLAFATDLGSVPSAVPYLRVPPDDAARWRDRLGPRTVPRIGIAWSGAPGHGRDQQRSVPCADLAPLLDLPGYEFHSVQKEIRDADLAWLQAHPTFRLHPGEPDDFADTAARLAEMDLVITVDTSIAHLAGALGRPTWIMLGHTADWRWMLGREDTPWYPTARLFRQASLGDWAGVVARLVQALPEAVRPLSPA
jgi:tetratricopeptide (TPR) repeat protein